MKKFIAIVFCLLFTSIAFASPAKVIVNSVSETFLDVSVDLPQVELTERLLSDGNTYHQVIVPGGGVLEVGKPNVPGLGNWILIPNGTQPQISVDAGIPVVYENISLAPIQMPKADKVGAPDPEFIMDEIVFSTDAYYPGVFAETDGTKRMRGQDCTILWVYPYQYNPVQKTLSVYENLQVSVNFSGIIEAIPANLRSDSHENMLKAMAINGEDVLDAEKNASGGRTQFREDGAEFLIITANEFLSAANTLAQWKRSMGITTTVAITGEIGTTTAQIEEYIDDAYENWDPAPSYFMLLGDAEFIPTFYENTHPYHFSLTGTDIFYADVDQPADYVADMAFGRMAVDTPAQADSLVARVIRYEKTPPTQNSYYDSALLACYFQDNDGDGEADRRFSKTSEDIRNYLDTNNYSTQRIYVTDNSTNPSNWTSIGTYIFENDTPGAPIPPELQKPDFPWDGDDDDINNSINMGKFFVVHRDHGYREGWGDPAYDIYDVQALDNGDLRPVVWTINCETGWFDNETDDGGGTGETEESFVEYWLRHATGGSMGLIGSTRVSYSGHNDRLVWGFMDAIWPDFIEGYGGSYGDDEPILTMSDVVNYGKNYMMTMFDWGDVTRTTLEQFEWFGDPTMKIWTNVPRPMTTEHIGVYLLGVSEFQIDVMDQFGTPIENAAVALSYNGDLVGVATTDEEGATTVYLEEPILELGEVELVVTADGKKPYIEMLPIVAGMGVEGYIQDVENSNLLRAKVEIQETGFRAEADLETGFFRVYVIEPGNYTIKAKFWGYEEFLSDSIYVAEDDTTEYNIQMTPVENYGTIEGIITTDTGDPLSDVMVELVDIDLPSITTDANGFYIFTPLVPIQEYSIAVTHPNYEPQSQTITLNENDVAQINFAMAYIEIFEETEGNFHSDGGFLNEWEWGAPTPEGGPEEGAYSGTNCWGTDLDGEYSRNRNMYLYSSVYSLTLSTTPSLIFYTWYETEEGWDGGNVQITTDDGEIWTIIHPIDGYPDNIVIGLTGTPGFTGESDGWERREFDLTEYADQIVRFRLRFATTNSEARGWFIDNFAVNGGFMALATPTYFTAEANGVNVTLSWEEPNTTLDCTGFNLYRKLVEDEEFGDPIAQLDNETLNYVDSEMSDGVYEYGICAMYGGLESGMTTVQVEVTTGIEDNPAISIPKYYSLSQNFPNPFNPSTEINYAIPNSGLVNLSIYNLNGQLVRTLVDEKQDASYYSVKWDGKNNEGQSLNSGVYVYKIQAHNYSKIRKMILLK